MIAKLKCKFGHVFFGAVCPSYTASENIPNNLLSLSANIDNIKEPESCGCLEADKSPLDLHKPFIASNTPTLEEMNIAPGSDWAHRLWRDQFLMINFMRS